MRAESPFEGSGAGQLFGLSSAVWLGLCGGALATSGMLVLGLLLIRLVGQRPRPNLPAGGPTK